MYVRAGRPAFARPCVGVHRSTSLMSSSLLLQQCPACLVKETFQRNVGDLAHEDSITKETELGFPTQTRHFVTRYALFSDPTPVNALDKFRLSQFKYPLGLTKKSLWRRLFSFQSHGVSVYPPPRKKEKRKKEEIYQKATSWGIKNLLAWSLRM